MLARGAAGVIITFRRKKAAHQPELRSAQRTVRTRSVTAEALSAKEGSEVLSVNHLAELRHSIKADLVSREEGQNFYLPKGKLELSFPINLGRTLFCPKLGRNNRRATTKQPSTHVGLYTTIDGLDSQPSPQAELRYAAKKGKPWLAA